MITAIIQARMGSSRLPGKVLLDINGKPVLGHVVSRVAASKYIEQIIVATTTEPADDPIEKFCQDHGISVCRGSELDVLDRYYQCAMKFSADIVVRVTADCPLHDAIVIDQVIRVFLEKHVDYASNTFEYTYPDGLDVEVFTFPALEDAWKNAHRISEREHVTPYIRNNPALDTINVTAGKLYPHYRLTLDTPEDFNLINKIFEGIGSDEFGLEDIVAFLEQHPELVSLNKQHGLNEGYIKSLVMDAKKDTIRTKRLYLRHLQPSDASEQYLAWLNDPVVNRFLETRRSTMGELQGYIRKRTEDPAAVFLGIFLQENNEHIGNVKLEPIDFSKREATMGILVGETAYWGQGICYEVVNAIVNYSFSQLNLERITLGVRTENIPAISCYKKAGFSIDAIGTLNGSNSDSGAKKLSMSIDKTKWKTGRYHENSKRT